jgi:hypothetical protein
MVLQALEWDADLICIVGADQVHPLDMLSRLVDRYFETQGGVISALVPFRGYVAWQFMKPFQPMGWRIRNDQPNVREFRGMDEDPDMFVPIDPADGDLQRVDEGEIAVMGKVGGEQHATQRGSGLHGSTPQRR